VRWKSNLIAILAWLASFYEGRVANFGAIVVLDLDDVWVF
jgi:hypothetical protein